MRKLVRRRVHNRAREPALTANAITSDRLLDGEDPATDVARDARHWIAVYREMITFKEDLLKRVNSRLAKLPRSARRDVSANEVGVITEQLERYRRRLEFWFARHWELEGLHIDEETRSVGHRDRSVTLTKREYQLLIHLAARAPAFVSTRRLLVDAWNDGQLPEESLRTYIVRLRNKIARLEAGVSILNRPRSGYALVFANRA
jgi:DNA-binding response OmpR family regulator